MFRLRSQVHSLSLFYLHADGDSGGLHRHGHDHGHFSWPERCGSRQHLHDHHVRLHDGESEEKKTPLSLRFCCSDLRLGCGKIIPPAFADFLGSPGQPAQHQGLAGLAQVLQHSPLRPRCKPRKGRITDLNMTKKPQIEAVDRSFTSKHRNQTMCEVNILTVPVCTGWYWSAPSRMPIWTGVMCCSGREDQRVCGFEVLRGGCDRKQQHVGGGQQQQHEPGRPDVRKPAAFGWWKLSLNRDLLALMRCECMCVPGAQGSSTSTTWE